ncbi:MAG: septum site determining protein [Propionibacteriales bacterium]|nr:septum site determining protein [Propionibacteriales bacterium]
MQVTVAGPVLVTADDELSRAVSRAAAAAGVLPARYPDPRTVVPDWGAAPVVLIGADRLADVAEQALPRRAQVFVVTLLDPGPSVLGDALRCGATEVLVLPADETRLVDVLSDTADGPASSGLLVGVLGGTGGAGASTFAAALGLTWAAASGSALVVDADVGGGGTDQVLGVPAAAGVRWDVLEQASGRFSARSLQETLPAVDGLSVVTWPGHRSSGLSVPTLRSVIAAGRRGFPVVLVDLPRADPAVLGEVLPRCDAILVLSTVTVPALAACLHATRSLPPGRAALVLRGGTAVDAADVEQVVGLPVWSRMADQRGLDEAISLGLGPLRSRRGPLARATAEVAARLGTLR